MGFCCGLFGGLVLDISELNLPKTVCFFCYQDYGWIRSDNSSPGVKRRIAGLHQNTAIGSTDITDDNSSL
ncbi:hypothetical protein ACET3Z_028735 [Daucus carota]